MKCDNGPLVLAQGRSRWAFFQQRTRKKENGRPMVHGVQAGKRKYSTEVIATPVEGQPSGGYLL